MRCRRPGQGKPVSLPRIGYPSHPSNPAALLGHTSSQGELSPPLSKPHYTGAGRGKRALVTATLMPQATPAPRAPSSVRLQPQETPADPHCCPAFYTLLISCSRCRFSPASAGERVEKQARRAAGSPPKHSLAPRSGTAPTLPVL